MTLTIIAVILLFICIVYKALINANYWYKLNKYKKLHLEYIKSAAEKFKKKEDNDLGWRLTEKKSEIINLFKNAGLQSFTLTINQFIGYGYTQPQQLDVFDNLTSLCTIGETSIPNTISNYFVEGIGIYKTRFKESFSVFYWINVLIFLPQKIINYLGFSLKGEKIKLIARTLNFVYWLLIIVVSVLSVFHFQIILLHT